MNEYYMMNPYKGNGSYFNSDGTVNINGGPKDGMIRTEADMKWLQAMFDAGYKFYPNQAIGKDITEMVFMVMMTIAIFKVFLGDRNTTSACRQA